MAIPPRWRYQIVLRGIDCPELSHKYSQEAASFVKKKMAGGEVVVKLYGKDRSKNYIGVVLLKDGTDVRPAGAQATFGRQELLEKGLCLAGRDDPLAL